MREIPKFYNSIEETKKEIFSLLARGVKDRKSNFHNMVLSSVDNENKPESRVVVLRGFYPSELSLKVHSDMRANKIIEIRKNKNISVVFYDDKKKIQLRIRGYAVINKSPEKSWEKLSNWSKRCYLTLNSPGSKTKEPSSGFPEKFSLNAPSEKESNQGFKNFCVLNIFINQIEWLFLASQGHRRALYEISRINSKIKIDGKWLTP